MYVSVEFMLLDLKKKVCKVERETQRRGRDRERGRESDDRERDR